MSEQELNAILEEIKNRGKTKNEPINKNALDEINFEFNSYETGRTQPKSIETELTVESDADEYISSAELDGGLRIEEKSAEPVFEPTRLFEKPAAEESVLTEETPAEEDNPLADEYDELPQEDKKKLSKKTIIIAAVAVLLVAAVGVGVFFALKGRSTQPPQMKDPATEQIQNVSGVAVDNTPKNPLTGEGGYNDSAIGKRPVAVVVENEYSTESVRPQWGLADADIVLEGESEYSTRLLLFWADYTTVPSQVGPARSARPPFIKFSELFDAVFIHAGYSHSKGDYVGADAVFKNDNVDHVNLLQTSGDGTYFGRDRSRTSTVEHTGYLNGTNVAKMLEAYNINTSFTPENYTQLSFNDQIQDLSQTSAKSIDFRWTGVTSGRCPKTGKFTYDEESGVYTTTDFDSAYGKSGVRWENLVFLLDNTTYVVKANYKGSGSGETYCNYSLSGGKGLIASNGTAVEISWGVSNGKLWFKDSNGNEVKLNPGKTYIGYGSQNHGGYAQINE